MLLSRDRVNSNFVAIVPELLHVSVVGVLMRKKECGRHWATVRVGSV